MYSIEMQQVIIHMNTENFNIKMAKFLFFNHWLYFFLNPSIILSTNSFVKCKNVVISPVIFLISKTYLYS